jgi:hypothetical protein
MLVQRFQSLEQKFKINWASAPFSCVIFVNWVENPCLNIFLPSIFCMKMDGMQEIFRKTEQIAAGLLSSRITLFSGGSLISERVVALECSPHKMSWYFGRC